MVAGAGLNDRDDGRVRRRGAPAAIARLAELGVPFNTDSDGEGWHLTREGGHSARRIVHVDDATGWAVQQALEKAAAANPNITIIPDMVAIDLVTGRHGQRYSGDGHVWGVYALNKATREGRDLHRPRDDPRHRRRGPRLSLLDRAARRDRRRHRDGVAGRLPGLQHGVHAVPPDLPLQSGGQELPDHRGGARRGRAAEASRRPAIASCRDYDERAELAPRDVVARAIDHEIKRDGLDYVHLDISHMPPSSCRGHFPNIYARVAARPRHRHDQGADPGRPRPALHLRRRHRRPRRPHRSARPLCGRRSAPSPACTAPTGSPPTPCSNASSSARRRPTISPPNWDDLPAAARRSAPGTKAGSPIPTRRW